MRPEESRDKFVRAIQKRISKAIEVSRLKNLVVAVSGGPDSSTLLDCLASLQDRLGLNLHGANINHGLSGESPGLTESVKNRFARYGLPLTMAVADVAALKLKWKMSEEAAARRARYEFLAEVVREVGAEAVVLGHTQDDQVETVLLNLLRGAGLAGLSGMGVVDSRFVTGASSRLTLLRPMLAISHGEALKYCLIRELKPHFDPSNDSDLYRRNRVRHQLLPLMEELNPRIRGSLLRLARVCAQQTDYLNHQALLAMSGVVKESPTEDTLIINRVGFRQLDKSLQALLLRKLIEDRGGDLTGVEFAHFQAMVHVLRSSESKEFNLPGKIQIRSRGPSCEVRIVARNSK